MPGADRDPRRLRLLRRIQSRHAVLHEKIPCGDCILDFTRIARPNQVLDDVVARADRARRDGKPAADSLPYWAEMWDSAGGILQILPDLNLRNRRVLDLGCGMGLAGVAAAAHGACVLMADLETDALLLARLNAMPYADRCRIRRVDWRTDRLGQTFDLILGSDIIYERGQWEWIEKFLTAHLAPNGSAILGEPGRQTGDEFPDWISRRGWSIQHTQRTVPGHPRPIRIYSLEKVKAESPAVSPAASPAVSSIATAAASASDSWNS